MDLIVTDYWFYNIGVNVIPADSMNKTPKVKWTALQDKLIADEVYEGWKRSGVFKDGCAIIMGKIWRGQYKDKYLASIYIDNKKGNEEVLSKFGKVDMLEKLAEKTVVEQHLDAKEKAHIYFIVEKPLSKKSGIGGPNDSRSTEIPAIEVKSEGKHGIMYCSPSIHKNGHPYKIIGTTIPTILDKEQSEGLEKSINEIYTKYSAILSGDNKTPIEELFKPNFEVYEGNNRSGALMRAMESMISRNRDILSADKILRLSREWNQEHCKPPLDDSKLEYQWNCAKTFIHQRNTSGIGLKNNTEEGKSDEKSSINLLHLLNSIKERWVEVFIDQFDRYYITIIVKDHTECIPLNSSRFKGIVRNEYFEKERKIVSEDRLEGILTFRV